jgi:hypothetical protein
VEALDAIEPAVDHDGPDLAAPRRLPIPIEREEARRMSGTSSPTTVSPDANPTLSWLGQLLCPAGSGLRLSADPSREAHTVARWLALPSASRPRLLAPAGGPPAAAALAQFNDSMTQVARMRKWAIGQALRIGAGKLRRHDYVAIVGDAMSSESDLLGSVLPELLSERVETAVVLGPGRRPNAKPVLQLLRSDGRVIAYAKIGWNDLTRELIENEHRVLTSWEARPPATFAVPRALGSTTWNRLSILLVSPAPHRLFRSGPRNAPPPSRTVREVGALGGMQDCELANAPFLTRLDREADRLVDEPVGEVARSVIASTIDRDGHRKVAVGTAHGDWGPWNMSRVDGTLHVWDWERTADGVPIGLDVLHLHCQTSIFGSRRSVPDAVSRALAEAREQLVELEVDPHVHRSLMNLYLVERLLRLAAGRSEGVPIRRELLTGLIDVLSDGGGTS